MINNDYKIKMRIILITLSVLFFGFQAFAQDLNKTILRTTDIDWLHANDGQSDTLYYLDMTPELHNGTILILMSGWFG